MHPYCSICRNISKTERSITDSACGSVQVLRCVPWKYEKLLHLYLQWLLEVKVFCSGGSGARGAKVQTLGISRISLFLQFVLTQFEIFIHESNPCWECSIFWFQSLWCGHWQRRFRQDAVGLPELELKVLDCQGSEEKGFCKGNHHG